MLTTIDLGRSRARRDILALFFLNPEKAYYQRQLERLLAIPVGNVRRELRRLEKEALLGRERFGNLILFRLNPGHPLYREIRAVVLKTAGIAPRLEAVLADIEGLRLAFLHGSYAHELAGVEDAAWTGESDVDLVAAGETRRSNLLKALRPVEEETQRKMNFVLYDLEEFRRKLAEPHDFLRDVLREPILPLVGFGQRRGTKPVRTSARKILTLLGRGDHEARGD